MIKAYTFCVHILALLNNHATQNIDSSCTLVLLLSLQSL